MSVKILTKVVLVYRWGKKQERLSLFSVSIINETGSMKKQKKKTKIVELSWSNYSKKKINLIYFKLFYNSTNKKLKKKPLGQTWLFVWNIWLNLCKYLRVFYI